MDLDLSDFEAYRQIDTRSGAREAFDRLIGRARQSIRLFDDRGEFWGLQRPSFAAAIKQTLGRSRLASVCIILHDTAFVEKHCPRLMALLGPHSPRLRVMPADPSLRSFSTGVVILDSAVVMRRPHFDQTRVFVDFDETGVAAAEKMFAEMSDSALPALSGYVTGL
jgi:hypothetical protein